MHFHDKEFEGVAITTIQAATEKLALAVQATRLPLPESDLECIEELTDRLVGLRQTVTEINEALQAVLRRAEEDEHDND